MAGLPSTIDPNTPLPIHDGFVDALERGENIADIAKRIHPDDKRARSKMRKRLRKMALDDPRFQTALANRARLNMMLALPSATKALGRRAGHGNVPAIKLLFEASGLHNPRVKHEHSGEIVVRMEIPRPSFDEPVADATVVEDHLPAEIRP